MDPPDAVTEKSRENVSVGVIESGREKTAFGNCSP
jgi:hypothetical protein